MLHVPRPTVCLTFLENPVDFGALDGKPVVALFALISPTVRAHLHLLSRLSFALREAAFKQAVVSQANREEILASARRAEGELRPTVAAVPAV